MFSSIFQLARDSNGTGKKTLREKELNEEEGDTGKAWEVLGGSPGPPHMPPPPPRGQGLELSALQGSCKLAWRREMALTWERF